MLKIAVSAGMVFMAPLLRAQETAPPPATSGTQAILAADKKEKFTDPNPALLYWQSFALLPELKPSQLKLVTDVLDGRLPATDPSVAALLEGARRALERFARAARGAAPCVWGTTIDEGPFT